MLQINELQRHLGFLALHSQADGRGLCCMPKGRRHRDSGRGEGLVGMTDQLAAHMEAVALKHRFYFMQLVHKAFAAAGVAVPPTLRPAA